MFGARSQMGQAIGQLGFQALPFSGAISQGFESLGNKAGSAIGIPQVGKISI